MVTTKGLPAPEITRPRGLMVGTMFACAAAFMFFLGVIGIYVLERAEARDAGVEWFPEGVVELGPSGFIFWTFILSIFTVQWAVQAINADDRINAYVALALTGLFGRSDLQSALVHHQRHWVCVGYRQRPIPVLSSSTEPSSSF